MTRPDIEEATFRAFVRVGRAQRLVALLASPSRRKKLLGLLDQFYDFDGRWIRELEKEEDWPQPLFKLLRSLGAPDTCYLISSWFEYDGHELELLQALETIHATGMGTIISCIPGRLAYYEGEDQRFILERGV